MAMNIGSLKAALEFKTRGFFDGLGEVIDLGSQELHVRYEDFIYMCRNAGLAPNNREFEKLKNFPGSPRCPLRPFWMLLGAGEAVCSDINREHGAFYIDLNRPLSEAGLAGRYGLVTDFGNNEHVFNVGEAYRTMHRLCRKGGLIWINQSVYGGNGFFNFDQSFFEGMAAANRYSILYSAYVVYCADDPLTNQFHIPCSKDLVECLDSSKVTRIGIAYLFRKTEDNEFKAYYQNNAEQPDERFLVQFIGSGYPPEKYYLPIGTVNLIASLDKRELADLAIKSIPELFRRLARRLRIE